MWAESAHRGHRRNRYSRGLDRSHPASLGATDVFSQASVLGLYDPDRSQSLTLNGEIRGWNEFFGSLRAILAAQAAMPTNRGAGIHILTETITSPSFASQIREIKRLYPGAKWHQWEPAGPHNARAAAVRMFGEPVNTYYDFTHANVIVSLDAGCLPGT